MSVVISVENISKQYRLGLVGTGTFKDDTKRFWAKLRGKDDPFSTIGEVNDRSTYGASDYVWSLRDINFDVKQGDIVGIIGKNGAGKSTLLKILSKVTSPTTGSVKAKGRMASLLEVGTGFHPELTGRENVFLNGAILGMRKSEINRKLDEIIAFAGVERYIDTPVKRYSSGMYVRLAFAVAAHLENEILIIDEVLAVGDAEFQKKCLGKMGEISKSDGRTILYVSHNMPSISTLCNRALLLENGHIVLDDSVPSCLAKYFNKEGGENRNNYISLKYKDEFELHSIKIFNTDNATNSIILDDLELIIETNFLISNLYPEKYSIVYHLYNENGDALFSFSHSNKNLTQGDNLLQFIFHPKFFQSGTFYLHFYLIKLGEGALIIEKDIVSFTIVDGKRELGVFMGREPGYIRPIINSRIVH